MIFVDCQHMMNILCIKTLCIMIFSDAVTAQDIKFVENIIDFAEQRNNPFKKDNCNIIKNIATGAIINQDVKDFFVSYTEYGRKAYENFVDERFSKKSKKFLDVIPKRKIRSGNQTPIKPLDIQKQNVKALKYIYYTHLKMYEIPKLLKYELSPVSLSLTRDNKLRKAVKHEITNALEEKLEAPPVNYVPVCDMKMAIFFDFMAYARKVSTGKLKTYGDFVAVLWKTINFLSKGAQRVGIAFD